MFIILLGMNLTRSPAYQAACDRLGEVVAAFGRQQCNRPMVSFSGIEFRHGNSGRRIAAALKRLDFQDAWHPDLFEALDAAETDDPGLDAFRLLFRGLAALMALAEEEWEGEG